MIYLSLMALAFAAWQLAVGTTPVALAMALCAAPALLCASFALRAQTDRRQ